MDDGSGETAIRSFRNLLTANRQHFDTLARGFGATGARLDELEGSLAAARSEIAQLQAQVAAYRVSTSWRLTGPVRWAARLVQSVGPKAVEEPPSAPVPSPPMPAPAPTYEEWMATAEAPFRAKLLQAAKGKRPVRPPRLGLVIVGCQAASPRLDPAMLAGPPDVGLLLLHPSGYAPREHGWPDRIAAQPVPPGATQADIIAEALRRLAADLVCFIDHEDMVAQDALALVAATTAREPELDIVFGDEDWLDADGRRHRPFFKPGWNAELQRGRDLIGPFAFLRAELVRKARIGVGPAWRYDLANQVVAASRPDRVCHIPAVLCHRRAAEADGPMLREAAGRDAERRGIAARVESIPAAERSHRVVYALPDPAPLVSAIIPTRDRPDLLRDCTDALLQQTDYPALELLIVDNGSVDPAALALLQTLAADPRVSVLRRDGAFNWSALNNDAAARAGGDVLLLLNNDIAAPRPDWLRELVAHAVQPGVGAVGAKLLYPDGRVQHAGVTTDSLGFPRHLFRHAPGEDPGAFGLLRLARDAWGVTGACMAVPRAAFHAVGGLNEALPVACNDVDFCLRLSAAGYRIVWTPWAVLEHRELASRPPDHSPARKQAAEEEIHKLQRDWGALLQCDPFLHPALELVDEQPRFRLRPVTAPQP